jgi:hypothetical protein
LNELQKNLQNQDKKIRDLKLNIRLKSDYNRLILIDF